MNNRKWLQRKFPKTFNEVNDFLDDEQLSDFKKGKYKLGRLTSDVIYVQKYCKGTLLMFKRRNPVTDENYPLHHGVVKCKVGFTESGYHSIAITDENFVEITE
jgi:hypothetical protein